jgi:hypothetical protein
MALPPEHYPKRALAAFRTQLGNARSRGIPFEFSLQDWWAWWQTDNRWLSRGKGKFDLCMARINDVGPYSIENVYCTTNSQNGIDGSSRLGQGKIIKIGFPLKLGLLKQVNDWRCNHRLPSRSEAIRELLEIALKSQNRKSTP